MPSRAELANHLDLSRAGAQDLIARKILPASGTLDEYRTAYIRHLRGRAAGQIGEGGLVLADERARLAKEQADRLAMDNAEARGETCRWEDVESFMLPAWSGAVQRLLAVPAQAAPEAHGTATIAETEAVFQRCQFDALREVADQLAEGAGALRRGVAAAGAERRRRARLRAAPAQPEDGERVGGGASAGAGRDESRAGSVEE